MAHHWPTRQRTALGITAFSLLILISVTLPSLATSVAHASATYAATVLADGPVSYWRLGEPSGTTAADSGPGGNTGTYNTGTTPGVSGAITSDTNTAAQFNGTTGYVSVPDNANLDITGDMTLEMWAKPGLLNGTTQTVLQKGTSANVAGTGWQYRVSITSANRWKAILFVGGASFELVDNVDTLSTARWDYLVVVRSGSTVTFYVNGRSVANIAISGATNTTTGMLAFGRAGGYSNYYYNGSIDEVAIYSVALSTSQIVNHFTVATSVDAASPTATATAQATGTVTPTATIVVTPTGTATPMATATGTPTATATTPPSSVVVLTAGDISCDPSDSSFNNGDGTSTACQEKWTAAQLTAAQLTGVTPVFALGDEQYDCATTAQLLKSYGISWGLVKSVTYPAVGNHEYKTTCGNAAGAGGYYTYFGSAASPLDTNCTINCKGYYSFDLGSWHIVVLNSECAQIGGCQAGSPQEQWLQADLAAHPAQCTLAYWHRPYYTSGWSLGDAELHDIWTDLYNAHAELVLNGHDHDYERFSPQDANGNADPNGLSEIIVGTGGDSLGGFNGKIANSAVRNGTTYGVLQLTLSSNSYSWQFLGDGHSGTFTDSGTASCH